MDQELRGTEDYLEFDAKTYLVELGGGLKYEVPNRTILAAYITFGSQLRWSVQESPGESVGEADRIEDDSAVYMFPSFKLALEHWLTDWFCVRGGSQAKFFGQTDSTVVADPLEPDTTTTYSSTTTRAFWDWNQASRL